MARVRNKKTNIVEGHSHTYIIDARGQGRTSRECHPQNPNICHSHRIAHYKVEDATSECYPDCPDPGAPGVGNHKHEITLGKNEAAAIERLKNKPKRFKVFPSVIKGKRKFVNKQRRLTEKSPSQNYGDEGTNE